MYHEHPLKILKYLAKNIWLLIFPLIRGIYAVTLDINQLYTWLKGAWFDIAVIILIFIFGLIQWRFSVIALDEKAIIHNSGVFFKVKKIIPYENVSSITAEKPMHLRPFGGIRIYCDTCAGIFKTSDMKLLVNKGVCREIMRKFPDITEKDGKFHKPAAIYVILLSAFFSSGFSGTVYIAALFFKSGDIVRDMISVSIERIADETSRLSEKLIFHIPTAAVGIGIFFIFSWVISFALNLMRYAGFRIKSDDAFFRINCGYFTKREFNINSEYVNYTDLRQSLLMKYLKIVTVSISCAGYGTGEKQLPVLFPVRKKNKAEIRKLFSAFTASGNVFRPSLASVWQYIWMPVILSAAVIPAAYILPGFFGGFSELIRFALVMAELPLAWLTAVNITALITNGIFICGDKIMIKYSVGFSFHSIVTEQERLVKISIRQTLFQKPFKKCTMVFCFNGEVTQNHSIKAIRIADAEKIINQLGYRHCTEIFGSQNSEL